MRPLTKDATTALVRALSLNFANVRAPVFEEIVSRSWASATFAGARHTIAFRLEGAGADVAAEAFVDTLETAEFNLRGHIVADIALVSESRSFGPDGEPRIRIAIEALTVEDG